MRLAGVQKIEYFSFDLQTIFLSKLATFCKNNGNYKIYCWHA